MQEIIFLQTMIQSETEHKRQFARQENKTIVFKLLRVYQIMGQFVSLCNFFLHSLVPLIIAANC